MESVFLHVGCGPLRRQHTTIGWRHPQWREIRLDIDPDYGPDVTGSMVDMSSIATGSVDALYSSHNIEHLYPHEVPLSLREFHRVLKPDGFAVITCPDLQAVAALVAADKLTEPASSGAVITPIDMIFGHRGEIAEGKSYMAHHTGFTATTLNSSLRSAGFGSIATRRRGAPDFDLWAVASRQPCESRRLQVLAMLYLPAAT